MMISSKLLVFAIFMLALSMPVKSADTSSSETKLSLQKTEMLENCIDKMDIIFHLITLNKLPSKDSQAISSLIINST